MTPHTHTHAHTKQNNFLTSQLPVFIAKTSYFKCSLVHHAGPLSTQCCTTPQWSDTVCVTIQCKILVGERKDWQTGDQSANFPSLYCAPNSTSENAFKCLPPLVWGKQPGIPVPTCRWLVQNGNRTTEVLQTNSAKGRSSSITVDNSVLHKTCQQETEQC